MYVDAGNLFSDDRYTEGQPLSPEVMTKNKWVVKGYGDFSHDAANISYEDLPYAAYLFSKDGFDARAREFPFLKRLISANVSPSDPSILSPAPYVIRELQLNRSGRAVRVGIVGFTDGKPSGPQDKQYKYGGFEIEDPFTAAKRVLTELREKADIIIALAYMPQDMAQRLASENPEIDTIIGARKVSSLAEPQHFSRATITYAYSETKYVGELRYYLRGDGSIENQVNRFVQLDSVIPDDPAAQNTVTAAHNDYSTMQSASAGAGVAPTSVLQESGKRPTAIGQELAPVKPEQ